MNTKYVSPGLSQFYSNHRFKYHHFYPSERAALESLGLAPSTSILDIGCACGGLGLALHETFGCERYVGLEIHEAAARIAAQRVKTFGGSVVCGDVLNAVTLLRGAGQATEFDVVVSLGALDWNTDVVHNVNAAWHLVREGGVLLMSLRLHADVCLLDRGVSYQSTTPGGSEIDSEIAPYVVISVSSAMAFVRKLGVSEVSVHGFVGKPSTTAVSPIRDCIFAVAALRKDLSARRTTFEIVSPEELRTLVEALT